MASGPERTHHLADKEKNMIIWQSFLTGRNVYDVGHIFDVPYNDILEEITTIEPTLKAERTKEAYDRDPDPTKVGAPFVGSEANGWNTVSLFSKTGRSDDILVKGITDNSDEQALKTTYRNLRQHMWTPVSLAMPRTTAWIESCVVPYILPGYVRISRLDGKGMIPPHSDTPRYVYNQNGFNTFTSLSVLFITLSYNPMCKTVIDGVELDTKQGSAYLLNQRAEHYTTNFSPFPRFNMRVHGMYTKKFRDRILGD